MTTQFDRVYHGLTSEVGKFRVAASGMAWKGSESEGVTSMAAADIKWAQWIRVARNFQLRVGLKSGNEQRRETFDGFTREDHDRVAKLLKDHFSVTLETRETSLKGWNWGVTDFQGQDLAFTVSDKTAFELPLQYVANSNIAGKTEVSLDFANPSSSKKSGDEMVEIRFYVPGTQSKFKGSDAGSDNENDEEEISAATVFHDMVKEKADIGKVLGDMVLSFEEVLVLTPRGRYDVIMFPEFLRLRGKTYDYKIEYTKISRLFLLPKDDLHVLFILGLTHPIRQGQTPYQYLIMQFSREEETTAELNMDDEEVAKYEKLKKNYDDPTFEVVSSVFRALSNKKIIGSGTFQGRDGHPGIKANLKAVQGDLFMLEKYIFFVSKQPSLIELSDVEKAVFSRVGSSMGAAAARTFDLKIATKSGSEITFTNINKEEHEPVEQYLKEKKIRIKNEMVPDADLLMAAAVGEDDDEDMQSVSSEGSAPKAKTGGGGGEDEDSEEDEDFQASSSDEGSPTDTDSSEGGAATASDASGDRDFAVKKKKKTKTREKGKGKEGEGSKKVKKTAADSDADDSDGEEKPKKKKAAKKDDAMDVDEDKPKPKPKPKPKAKKDDEMDVDENNIKAKERPKPKPVKPKADGDGPEPPKKKQRTIDD
ncbi:fact complex subunit pob3 [Moniliophthora roreri MCA 2997]|uniref:FACT complex subunit POB3 n=1 Tax=Moniliophthora roreri (strain MCA 2997) TaxID=1381753 RepID=V2XNB2_MONRO|nr:fact complex subunit pob3 [Moniliophthora roreri MCA 2997]KAI3616126.1 fact complex subunit pob3 [Moniliophthora roreri]